MSPNRWLAIAVATLVWAIALWFGFFSLPIDRTVGLAIIAVGLVFSMYALAGFSGAIDIGTTGFRASLIAIGVVLVLLLAYWGSGIEGLVVASPVLGAGFGGAYALAPNDDAIRFWSRCAAAAVVSVAMVWVFGVDSGVYGLVVPLVSFAPLGIADRIYERAREVVGETAPD